MGAAGQATPSRGAKILRRTLSGGALAGSLTLLLLWSKTNDRVVPIAVLLVALALVWEVARMGSWALVDLLPPLLTGVLAAALLAQAQLEGRAIVLDHARDFPDAANGVLAQSYWRDAAFVALTALAVHALQSLRAPFWPRAWARGFAFVGIAGLLLWQLAEAHNGLAGLRFAALVMGIISAGWLLLAWRRSDVRRRALFVGALALWILPPLFALDGLRLDFGLAGLVTLLVASKIGDTCGYYVGGSIGKTHPFPRISPGKTTAGCVASLVGCVAVIGGLYLAGLTPDARYGVWGVLVGAAVVNLAAQAGDLLESWAKRKAGVKDSSTWFGPSGGLFDQVDSLLLTIPTAVLVWPFVFERSL